MSSQLQIEANRRNAQKSTGPRTPAGKAASSLNHTQSGLYAESQIIIGERQCDFEDLAAAFHARYQPDSPVAQSLLDIAIHAEWLLRRLRRAETGIWDYFIDDHDYGNGTTALGRTVCCNDRSLARLQRRLDSLQRNFHRAIKELDRLKAASPGPGPEPGPTLEPQPKPATQETVIGFVPPAATARPACPQPAPCPPPPPSPQPAPSPQIGFESSPSHTAGHAPTPALHPHPLQ